MLWGLVKFFERMNRCEKCCGNLEKYILDKLLLYYLGNNEIVYL